MTGYGQGLFTTPTNPYGTKQAARQYWKMFMATMEKKNFSRTHAEPWLLKRKDENGIVFICVYVDDCLITGDRSVDAAIRDMEEVFETRRIGPLQEYVGCTIVDMGDGVRKLLQPDLIKKLEDNFGKEMVNIRDPNTPMGQGVTIERPDSDEAKIESSLQQEYRSEVGMLLYLVKLSRPDISNAVRALTKVMDGATTEHRRLMLRTMKFVLNTKDRGIVIKRNSEAGVVVRRQ